MWHLWLSHNPQKLHVIFYANPTIYEHGDGDSSDAEGLTAVVGIGVWPGALGSEGRY